MRKFYSFPVIILLLLFVVSCTKQDVQVVTQPEATNYSSQVATAWMSTLQQVVQSEAKNPPVASRIYAYAAIGLYEAVLPGMNGYRSLQGQISGLNNLPAPNQFGKIDYIISANEALYQVSLKIFGALKPENIKLIEDKHNQFINHSIGRVPYEVRENSKDFGKTVAMAVLNRANNDGYAETRTLSYVVPSSIGNPSFWQPTNAVTVPLEPYWGNLKCFAMADGAACTIPSEIPFSTTPGSPFYNQAYEVYTTSLSLTKEQEAIARWWSDGSQTATPPGHWVAIADQIIDSKNLSLQKAAEVYTMLNIALADAFISCWDEKYRLNLLRPVTYVRNFIPGGTAWSPLLATPPFPEYPSGHSVASGAAGDILTSVLGNMSFTDSANTYLGYAPRQYSSFTHASNEAAISRLYGGIHFMEAIESGVKQGLEVSKAVKEKIKLRM